MNMPTQAPDKEALARLERQREVLERVGRQWRDYEGDLDSATRLITESAAEALKFERVSVWFYHDEAQSIRCHDLYQATPASHSAGAEVFAKDYPAYFEALSADEVIDAEDALTDPRTAETTDAYLAPNGIGALLDAPIHGSGKLIGVVSCEHVGSARAFHADERSTAIFLANMIGAAQTLRRSVALEAELKASNAMLRAAFETTDAGILATDVDGQATAYNQRFLELWSMPEALLGPEGSREARIQHVAQLTADPEGTLDRFAAIQIMPSGNSRDLIELADGKVIECVSRPQETEGRVIGRVWSFRDVTDHAEMEEELRALATHDPLTGLYNRRYAEVALLSEASRARRTGNPLCLAMVDIDRFKQVNDTHGHPMGDRVLRTLAEDIQSRLRTTDFACRWGGEEFLLILPGTDLEGAKIALEKLREHLGRPRENVPAFTVSSGIALYDGNENIDPTIEAADQKLYAAKKAGRNCVHA